MSLLSTLSRELFDYEREETTGEIIFFKLFELFVAYCTIQYAWAWGFYILRLSDVVLELGVAIYIDANLFFGNGLAMVVAGIITVCVLLGFFRISKWGYVIAMLLLHLQFAIRFTQGEIPHSSNVIGMTLMGLALGVFMFNDAKYRRRFTMGFTYFFVGLGYFMAAICKLIGTGIFWSNGKHLWIWIHEKAIDAFAYTGILDYNILQEVSLSSAFFATTILTIGLLSEFFAWAMWWRKFRTVIILAVLGLHMGIYLVMNIMFWQTFFELILLAFPFAVWIDKALDAYATSQTKNRINQIGLRFA
ncbi:MAG: hypothetical protein KTR29_04455 [Rhodothermaceae bacterium]|nr:hypothetical protein [Rhodothermaceae bacterium]